jgi:beta-lactamase regulating signal transducer with metallopeptidase domain
MSLTRNTAARKRYNLLITALLVFAAGTLFTFVWSWAGLKTLPGNGLPAANGEVVQAAMPVTIHVAQDSFAAGLMQFMNTNANNIVLFWLVMICVRSLQLIFGLQNLRRFRRQAQPVADPAWQQYVKEIAVKMNIHRTVLLAESAMAKVPMVIGHLKPLVLVPAGLLTSLPPAELEAILIHELAHIRRRDYLVNLLQSFMEIIFFFNPAIWWLSSLIRTEREHCCDDIVLQHTGSKKNYIQALVSCEEYQQLPQAYAMALKGSRKGLSSRVKRILSNNNTSLNLMEKSLLTVCLLAGGILMAAFTNKVQKETPETAKAEMLGQTTAVDSPDLVVMPQPPAVPQPEDAAVAIPQPSALTAQDPADYTAVPVAPVEIPEPPEAPEPVFAVNSSYQAVADEDQEKVLQAEHKRRQEDARQRENEARRQQADAARRQAEAMKRRDEAMAQAEERRAVAMREATRRHNEAVVNARMRQDEARKKADEARRRADDAQRSHDEAMRRHDEALRRHDEAVKKSEKVRREQESTTNVLLKEMVKDGIVGRNDKSLDFKLNNNEFTVNGVKQPEQVFRKYKEKYLQASGKSGSTWSVRYSRSVD